VHTVLSFTFDFCPTAVPYLGQNSSKFCTDSPQLPASGSRRGRRAAAEKNPKVLEKCHSINTIDGLITRRYAATARQRDHPRLQGVQQARRDARAHLRHLAYGLLRAAVRALAGRQAVRIRGGGARGAVPRPDVRVRAAVRHAHAAETTPAAARAARNPRARGWIARLPADWARGEPPCDAPEVRPYIHSPPPPAPFRLNTRHTRAPRERKVVPQP
jgi:hypothetical protein